MRTDMRSDVLVIGGGAVLWPRRIPRYRQFPFHCSKRAVCGSSRLTGPAWAIHAAAASAAAGLVQRRAAARGRLELERFAVVGFSNGGPHAAACAYKLGMRVSGTALAAPMPPLDAPGALRQLGVPGWYYPLARRAPWALRTVFAGLVALAGRDPRRAERVLLSGMSEPDRRLFSWPEWAGRFGADLAGAGSRGVVDDERPMPLPWGSRPNRSGAPCACGSASTTSWSRRACGWSGPAGFPSATRPWCPAWAIS
jgi:pimeloyl-ACP methyl ester carboxylesterase